MSHIIGYNRVSSESQSLDLGREALIKAGYQRTESTRKRFRVSLKGIGHNLRQCSRHYGKVMNALWCALTA